MKNILEEILVDNGIDCSKKFTIAPLLIVIKIGEKTPPPDKRSLSTLTKKHGIH